MAKDERKYLDEFNNEAEYMRDFGLNPYAEKLNIAIPDAQKRLMAGLQYYMGNDAKWLPEYDEIADWLTDNKGRGLLCVGQPGLGKTLICCYILPMLLHKFAKVIPAVVTAVDMNKSIDKLLAKSIVIVDDIGTESPETITFGERRYPFAELVDSVERRSSILILTTNLWTRHYVDKETGRVVPSIEDRYGLRTLDRLRAITSVVELKGSSMRR